MKSANLEWTADDVRKLELAAVSVLLGTEAADLDALVAPLLALDISRAQFQPVLEQACRRMQALRERVAELRGRDAADAEVSRSLTRAAEAMSTGAAPSLQAVEDALATAFDTCQEHGGSADHAAELRAVEALAAGVSLEFSRGASLSDEAAALTHDPLACRRYRAQQAQFLLDQGRELNDIDALERVQELCVESLLPALPADECPDERAAAFDLLGQALGILGRQRPGTHLLEGAIDAFQDALALRVRSRDPFEWAATQNNLGNALGVLGQRRRDLELLDRAVVAFEAALEVPASNTEPQARASANSNLAAVLQTIGRQRQDADALKQSIDAYRAALAIWTAERKPLFWAATMRNVGASLRLLGSHAGNTAAIEQAVDVYRAALAVHTRARMPREWALTQNDLGAALQTLAEETDDLLGLGQSVAAYREALKEMTREAEPMSWAMTMANLGVARRKLAERNGDATISRRAAADINLALDVFRDASHSELTALGMEQLSFAYELTAALEGADTD